MNAEERAIWIEEQLMKIPHEQRCRAIYVNAIQAAQREAMQERTLLLEHAALPVDKQIREWRERESTKKLGNLEYDEEIAFCHADLCADRIRALIKQGEE